MIHWWERIDREVEREALRAMIPGGGCLVLEGDEQAGLMQAAALLEETLNGFGYRTIRADLGHGRPVSIRALLLDAWKQLTPPPAPDHVPRWVQYAGSLTTGFISNELTQLKRDDERIGLVLVDVDLTDPLTLHEVTVLSDLARSSNWVLVITSSRESGSPWQALGSADRRLALRDFTYEDVRMCLLNTPELADAGVERLEIAAQAVVTAASGPIRPALAYTVLRAWSDNGE